MKDSQQLKNALPAGAYKVYSNAYKKALSFYEGVSVFSSNARAELAGLAAIRHKFDRLTKI